MGLILFFYDNFFNILKIIYWKLYFLNKSFLKKYYDNNNIDKNNINEEFGRPTP